MVAWARRVLRWSGARIIAACDRQARRNPKSAWFYEEQRIAVLTEGAR